MARRDRNQVEIELRRIEITRGMIGDLIARGEQIQEIAPYKVILATDFVKKFNCFEFSGQTTLWPQASHSAWRRLGCYSQFQRRKKT
jgi:hypothetical protein